jgi:hypothetical protein
VKSSAYRLDVLTSQGKDYRFTSDQAAALLKPFFVNEQIEPAVFLLARLTDSKQYQKVLEIVHPFDRDKVRKAVGLD